MGLLASIVAYLSVVAAIVIGFLVSADALIDHSRHLAANPQPELATAVKADSLKTRKTAKPPRHSAEQRAIPQHSTAAEYRRKPEPHKRTAHEAQRRYWPLQRQPAAAPRALGYAEEPRFNGNPWR